ncbi:MAG: TerC family protein [Planctomycetes bacterium]|nr:TerC family protein [Planctomycetota bacterium]
MTHILTSDNLVALLTLTLLEVVLGIDNIVFISILTGKLPKEQRGRAWRIGLALALVMRVGLLLSLSWVMSLTAPLFAAFGHPLSGRDLILLLGGLFLIGKATWEIHDKLEGGGGHGPAVAAASFASILVQIVLLDLVFSLDSVITAVGMARELWVMIAAVVIAIGVMLAFAQAIGAFVERHPTVKMLALSFLILIGVLLVADGFGQHVPKGYVYFAMAFSLGVELLNMRLRARAAPVELKRPSVPEPPELA